MRIIAGEAKGRILKTRDGKGTRPTDSRAREMLFNILRERIIDARVLDLYAGSGGVGLEALSRGAHSCVFIEQNAAAAAAIRVNVRACKYGERAEIWQTSVRSALRQLRETPRTFDLIFADPPFTRPQELTMLCKQLTNALDKAPQMLHNAGMLFSAEHNLQSEAQPALDAPEIPEQGSGLLVIQHHRKERPQLPDDWSLWQERKAGESVLSFFARAGNSLNNLN